MNKINKLLFTSAITLLLVTTSCGPVKADPEIDPLLAKYNTI